ncbi:MAG: hypothetical protein M1828_000898 [Chrysothrix sp. TS-e1954]|nr:MAG: hypothetical protein M1828_000898 [Chrysothrix sp. TS-e1954]
MSSFTEPDISPELKGMNGHTPTPPDPTMDISTLNSTTLAMLVSLIADHHLIIRTASKDQLETAQSELESATAKSFGFTAATVHCSASTTLEDFVETILVGEATQLDHRKVANVVIARELDLTERNVQIQALELMRTRRVFSRTAVHTTPAHFLLIALLPERGHNPPLLTPHLNDHFFMLHQFEPTINSLSPSPSIASLSSASSSSFLTRQQSSSSTKLNYTHSTTQITPETILTLRTHTSLTRTTAEIRRYTHNIPTFLRLHRFVSGGVSALSTRGLGHLSKILAVLNQQHPTRPSSTSRNDEALPPRQQQQQQQQQSYVTPSLVAMAARKVYPHRIELVERAEDERSMQWGSDREAVEEALQGASVERVLEEVLDQVECPL